MVCVIVKYSPIYFCCVRFFFPFGEISDGSVVVWSSVSAVRWGLILMLGRLFGEVSCTSLFFGFGCCLFLRLTFVLACFWLWCWMFPHSIAPSVLSVPFVVLCLVSVVFFVVHAWLSCFWIYGSCRDRESWISKYVQKEVLSSGSVFDCSAAFFLFLQ